MRGLCSGARLESERLGDRGRRIGHEYEAILVCIVNFKPVRATVASKQSIGWDGHLRSWGKSSLSYIAINKQIKIKIMKIEERRLFIKQFYLKTWQEFQMRNIRLAGSRGVRCTGKAAGGQDSHVFPGSHISIITKPANELISQWKTRWPGCLAECLHGHTGWVSREIRKNISPPKHPSNKV